MLKNADFQENTVKIASASRDPLPNPMSKLLLKSHQRWSPPVVVGGPCVLGSEWPWTSRPGSSYMSVARH